jgi:ATP synthase protein I
MIEGAQAMDKETRKSLIQVANISSMGIALGVTIFGCFFIGLYLDRKLGTAYFFTFLFLLIGILAGFKNIYGLIKKSLGDEKSLDKPVDKSRDKKDESERENASAEKD